MKQVSHLEEIDLAAMKRGGHFLRKTSIFPLLIKSVWRLV